MNVDGKLHGAVITHVDDFNMAGTEKFRESVLDVIREELTISKVEDDMFRYTGLDFKVVEDGVEVSMEDYADSLEDVTSIRKVEDRNETLMKMYRKMTWKLAWLANSTRPDLCYHALQMSKKNQGATIADLRDVNRILKRVRERRSMIKYGKIGDKEDLILVGVGDASHKQDDKAIGGIFLFLSDSSMKRASPVYWKSKQISRVCHSSKDAETLNLLDMVEDASLMARQLELLLYGEVKGRIPVHLFTDSESTLESVASSKQVGTKSLRNVFVDLKERLVRNEVSSYSWLPTKNIWADVLTKEMILPEALEKVLDKNEMELGDTSVNQVKAFGQEVHMINIRNRKTAATSIQSNNK